MLEKRGQMMKATNYNLEYRIDYMFTAQIIDSITAYTRLQTRLQTSQVGYIYNLDYSLDQLQSTCVVYTCLQHIQTTYQTTSYINYRLDYIIIYSLDYRLDYRLYYRLYYRLSVHSRISVRRSLFDNLSNFLVFSTFFAQEKRQNGPQAGAGGLL